MVASTGSGFFSEGWWTGAASAFSSGQAASPLPSVCNSRGVSSRGLAAHWGGVFAPPVGGRVSLDSAGPLPSPAQLGPVPTCIVGLETSSQHPSSLPGPLSLVFGEGLPPQGPRTALSPGTGLVQGGGGHAPPCSSLAATTFFHHVNLQYSTISEFCTGDACQTMAVCST